MIIQHNIMAINSHRQLTVNNSNLAKNLEKLSSGYRINKAADDAAGLAISEKMRAQITGLNRAVLNAQDGASLIQTAEGALTEVHSMLNRMVELATQSANGTIQADDRQKIESELTALKDEIDRISQATNFNGIKLLDGSLASTGTATVTTPATFTASTFTFVGEDVSSDSSVSISAASGQPTSIPANFASGSGSITAAYAGGTFTFSVTGGTDIEIDVSAQIAAFDPTSTTGDSVTVNLGAFGSYTLDLASGAASADTTDQIMEALASALSGNLGSITAGSVVPGSAGTGGLTMQVGDTADSFNMITVSVEDMSSEGLGIDAISMADQTQAASALDSIKAAIEKVSVNRGNLGALQNRLEHTINNLGVTSENMTAAESRIRDVDMAKEMMAFTKNNVLSQAAQAMLAQANQQPQQVLQLLR